MRDLLIAFIVFGSLPFILKRPFWGILMLAWLGYMNPHRLCYGFMLDMPVVQIVAITTLIAMLASHEVKRMVWSREIVVLLIFIAWMGVTTTQALFFDLAMDQYVKVIKIQILTFMTLLMLTSRERVHLFVWAIVLSIGFYGIKGGIFTVLNGGVYRVQGPVGTFIEGNNELALALIMTIPLIRYLQLQEKSKLVRLGLAIGMTLTALAAVGSQSRGALVGMAAMGTMFWLKSRNKFATAFLIIVAAVVVTQVMPEEWYERMNTIETYDEDASARGRINMWWMAWNLANDRIFGGGFEFWRVLLFSSYAPDPTNIRAAHSIYFQVLGDHGWVGLVLFLALLWLTWRKCSAVIRLAKQQADATWARDLAAMLQVSIVAYMSAGAFLGLAYFDYIYHLIAVAVVVHALLTRPQLVATDPVKSGTEMSSPVASVNAPARR
ncbi:MAG TPA: putative O-glycosylation ligase, exosortase A system-associated [Burkholderiaceae bacterium]|nr:putative O-glycosylation ligase, exosortase A system-associated [Burkholderiaceae bacterium]